jgi:hypothetical protein
MRTMRMKRATMPTAMPAFAPVESPLELAEPVVFPGLTPVEILLLLELVEAVVLKGFVEDPELACVVRLDIPVGIAGLEVWISAMRLLGSHIITIAVARSSFSSVRVIVGYTVERGVGNVGSHNTLVKTAPEGRRSVHECGDLL